MAASGETIELPLTLRLSKKTQEQLIERASASGTDLSRYVSIIVEQSTSEPMPLEEISGPIYQRFLESGMSDDQLSDLLEKEKHEARAEKRARRAT
jgi:hypothetical protein